MTIGVDASPLGGALTGIGWYVRQVLQLMLQLDPDPTFLLYSSRPPILDFTDARIGTRLVRPPVPFPPGIWRQQMLHRRVWTDGLSRFWGPANLLPMALPDTIPAVLTVHDLVSVFYPQSMGRYAALLHRLYFRRSIERADRIITVSARTRRDLLDRFRVAADKVKVVPQGVEKRFRPLAPELVQTRLHELGIRRRYILAVGTVEPRKNYAFLLRAFRRLPDDVDLVIAGGWGWKYRHVLRELSALELKPRVRFLNYVPTDDLVVLYNGARCLVLPSLYEGFGLPILQAMACGLPVLASNSSSLPEVGGCAACYFELDSLESLESELISLLNDDARCAQLRELGLARAREFTWERNARQLLTTIKGADSREESIST